MSCVNRSSKEFKLLAEHNDLSINTLELITHKYWLENKTEDYFPSDVYIQAQLGKIPYEEPIKAVSDLWDLKYKDPKEYTSLEDLQEARTEALKYFPEEAVTYHKNFKDNYILVIRKPVAKPSLSISDLTGRISNDAQEQADYDLITNNLISELGESSIFAKELKEQKQNNNNINDFINGKKKFNNLSEEENNVARRDQLLAAAGIQARRNEGSSSKESQDEGNERQERQVETWAKQNGVWHEDALSYGKSFGEELPGGQESHVYENPQNGTVIKVKNTLQYHDLQEFLDGIILHNTLFPETAYKVLGFGNDGEGFVAILEQPFVRGEEPTQEQITKHIKNIQPEAEMYEQELKNGRYKTSKTLIHDISSKNAIITPTGNIAIIDGIIRPNVASEGKGGNRAEDSSLIDTKTNNLNELQMSVSSPQTFTFKDGVTVRAPFKPNYQQEDALNAMDEFIKSDRTSMTLSGYAGTGKTSLMEMLSQKMRKQGKGIMFCASTNKAAAVLKERVSKSGFEAHTLNKVFGINVEVDANQAYNAKNLVNRLKDVKIPYGTTIIIDEASMINEENYRILNDIAKRNGLKIIYVGDAAQLAPVNETKISKVFRDQGHEVRTLSIVERTGDNAILKEATALRENKTLSGESSFNAKGQGVAYLKASNQQEKEAVIARFIPKLKENPNYFRILAYTNAAVANYNTKVRQLLGYNDSTPRVGEPITGYANWGHIYDRNDGKYRFINSEAYKVVKVESPRNARISLPDGSSATMQAIPITLENSMGEKGTFNLMDIKGNQENRRIATQLAQMKSQLWNKARGLSGKAKAQILQQINAIDEFLFVNDNITEGNRTLQAKVFDFGYAMTVHKSQGSTFTHVLMDDVDIDKAKDERNSSGIGLQDIAISWDDAVSDEPTTYEVAGPMEDVDMGDWGSETPSTEGTLIQEPPTSQQENAANIRQQLKYVAVSRATDTVTIISNNVKKEDSPLNHIKDVSANSPIKNNPIAAQNSTSVSTTTTQQTTFEYSRNANGRPNYEVSSRGDKRFSAMTATFAPSTTLFGHDVSGRTIESVYQHGVKQGDWTTDNNNKTGAPKDKTIIKGNTENDSYTQGYLPLWQEWAKQNPQLIEELRQKAQGKVITDMFASTAVSQARALADILNNTINQNNNRSNNKIEYGNDFRRIQETVRRDSQGSSVLRRDIGEDSRRRLARITKLELNSNTSPQRNSQWAGVSNKGVHYNIIGDIPAQLFHDIFEVVRYYTVNGELVDLHDDYSDCKCYLNDDGTCGFAIEPDGNLVSVFNLGLNRGFLSAIKDIAIAQGATHLDAFDSNVQPLRKIYEHTLGAKVASSMDYNMEYDHDNIAANHGNPQVVFMVMGKAAEGKVKEKHFNKDQYDKAQTYQQSFLPTQQTTVPTSYEGMITPDANTIFVFGSNPEGRHGAGAAKVAREKFGAIYGQGEGLQGNAYALPTKDLRVKENRSLRSISPDQITESIKKMYEVARQNPSKQFKVAYTNGLNEATLNGYTGAEMIKMFKDAGPIPSNVVFSKNWTDHWNEVQATVPEASASAKTSEIHLDTSAIFNNPSSTEVTVEDKMKPWRNDPSKQNISRRIYLKGQKNKGYFEVVKDFEDNYYSVHFKPTDSDNPNAFSKEEKEILFQAVADTLPVGSKLSTWGELSRGGIAGLERFSKLGFAKSGERTVTMKGTGEEVNIPVYTKFPNTTQRISLFGYEYFTDATEDTLVDAPWKIPLLQQLDAQFSNANPEGRNEKILKQMKAILDAESFEDWQNNANSETKQQVQKNLDEYDKLITQLNNLLDSDVITASEVRHVAELVVNAISDNLTQIQKEKGLAEQQFPTLNSKLDFQTASRKDIIQAIGIDRLIYRAKLLFDPENNEYEDLETLEQADLIIDNWDAIMTLAADIFAANEGVGISKDFSKGNWQSVNGQKIDFDNFNDYENDPDAMAEETKDEQEHWQVEQRTIDILNSMSAMVRLALHECYQIDKEGNIIMSKWGIPERVNARKAVNSILRWTQGSLSLEDMITKLSEKQGQHPWLSQLITRLSDKTGVETDFQSQFYGVFAKHFQLYSIVLLEDGKYHSMAVNSHPALSEAMQTITTQFRVGEHPLFTPNGINKKLLGNENTTSPKADFNLHKALAELQVLSDRIRHGEEVDAEMAEVASNNIIGVCRVLGYPVADSMVSEIINSDNILYLTKNLGFVVKDLDAAAKANKKDYDPFAFKRQNSIGGTLRNFLTPITDQLEDTATNAFYDSGKMYQSYVTPSFMTKLLQKFRLEGQDFEDFLEDEYGKSEWFKFKGRNGAWRNEWLRILAANEDARKVFDHKVELNFNKHSYMRNMTDAEYTLSLFAEYFTESSDDKQSLVPAWFRIPMQSNKPSSEFIKFYSYRGATYKEDIVHGLHSMFLQELSRIQTVNMRNKSKDDPSFIKNFDKNGKQFNFLPFLNSYLDSSAAAKRGRNLLETEAENNELASLLQKRIDTTKKLTPIEESRLDELVDRAIYNHMETRAQEILNRWEQEGILEAAKQVEGVGTEDADVRRAIENYLWNDCFAAKNILQLTVGDIAFYKDAEDLQKRLAQLHAPGIRGNVTATDYQGNRVSDGYYRTFILQDFDTFKSNIIANIAEVFDRKIANAPESQKAQLRALKESLVGKDGKYTKINVTDAQGYSSPSSYRKKAFMFGKWSHKAEDIYQKLLSGDYTYTDLETAFQPLKPFVYTHLEKHIGDGTPIETLNVPFQAKNSEYLLIMADALMQSEVKKSGELSRPNLLRAVYRVMEDSEKLNPTKGIDTVQFESAIKSGLQGKMNIHQFAEKQGGEEAAYTFMMSQIYQNYDPKKPVEEQKALQYNTDTFVHEAPYEDYCLQQEVPEHFKGHQQAHGSQIRMITPSDLDLYKDPNGNTNDENNINYYEWTEPDGTKRKVRADEFKREYEKTIAANIEESIENLSKELHLDSSDKKERNIALSKILLREILSSPRYGVDLAQACAVDKNTGEFRIPKGDPIQAKRIEQLINSIIKNRVNKQKIAGGPIVQVTNFGTSKQLHIRFNHKNGGLLLTREEYEGWETATHQTYEEYVKENQAGIAYFEVFIPIWANEIFEKFANEDGTIDVKAIEAVDPDLLKMISYRIPTEDKYSCAPMKVVGFMPREAGDAIMLPYELTEIDDSDFDVDKRYVMRKDIQIVENKPAIEKLLIQRVSESYAKAHDGKVNKRFITEQVKMYMDNPDRMKTADKLMETIHREKQIIMKLHKDKVWKAIKPTSGKLYRDNKIVDMTWAVLTNEKTADKILNPGGFDNFKRAGYMAAAYRLHSSEYSWAELQAMSIDELSDLCYVDKDLTWADTQIQFYKQNAAAASLIGVFAVNKVAHATLEGDDIFLAVDEICGEEPFAIAETVFSGRMQVDPKYDSEGNLIGKTLGSGVSASADAAKTPVLNLLNINMTTVGTFTSLLRLGMPHEDACMFIGQDVIARVLDEFNRQNLTGYASLNSVIDKEIKRLKEAHNISDDADINKEPLSKQELVIGLTPEEHEVIDYKVLIAFQKAKAIADSMRKLSFPTRFNSISSAVGPLIIDNLIMEHKMAQFMDENVDTHFYTHDDVNVDITDVFADHPVLKQFAKTVKIARQMTSDMPTGSTGFRNLLAKLPDDIKEKIYNDKKLFSSLSDFYQSYLAIASGLINPANLKNYIDGFPKWFMKQDFKEKYPDNALIQAIQMTVSKKTGRAFLSIKLTGEDETVKETYRNAWIDLHKSNPELSQQLFEYCFFRAGIGFSPKTFMAVVPTYVKERLQKKLSNGETATYLDTYRRFPSVTEELVIDQFIANNWEDNKLVPKKGGKNSHFTIKGDHLYATVQEDIDDLEGLTYIKTNGKGVTYLWKKVSDDKAGVHYVKMKPLGNNGEYVEMSLSEISTPLTVTTQTSENNDASEIKTTSPSETDATEVESKLMTPESKKATFVANLAKDYMTYNESSFGRKISETKAQAQANEMAEHPERFGSLMQKILESKGIKVNKDEAIRKLKDLDLC